MSHTWPATAAVILVALIAAHRASGQDAVRGERLGEALDGQIGAAIASYQMWDAGHRGGIGSSDRTTSGGLGWGEASFLRSYMLCYKVSRDPYWLDKLIDHFDRMVGNLSDPEGDGYQAWRDVAYSVGLVKVEPDGNVGDMTAEPERERVYVNRGGELVTGHVYRLEMPAADKLRVVDATPGEELETLDYADPTVVETIPGVKLTVKGAGVAGAAFVVKTTAPDECEYQVHDGMVTYPVAQFIEEVTTTKGLDAQYREKADEYAAILHKHFFEKWESTWVDLPDGSGLYKFSKNPTQRFPDTSLPHNQFLALGRTWVVLKDVPGLEHGDLYLDRATRMAKYFHQYLKANGDAYVWNYWDPLPEEEGISRHIEDFSHATIDIGFAVEAADRGVVFTVEDLRRFARTYSEVMWNGDEAKPRFGARVDTNEGDKNAWSEWILLGAASERVCDLASAIYLAGGRPPTRAPQMCYLYDRVVGVSDADRKACVANTEALAEMLSASGLVNTGFEFGVPGATQPFGWELTVWTPDDGGRAEWVDEGHSGEKAIALIGVGEKVNVLAQPLRKLDGAAGQTVTLTAYYRAGATTKPGFSIVSRNAEGEQVQYDNSPRFAVGDEWQQATWEVELAEGTQTFSVLLRNHGPGRVLYDDVTVELR